MTGAIDKLDLRIPAQSSFTREYADFGEELRHGVFAGSQPSLHYRQVVDMRKEHLPESMRRDVLLHLAYKRGDPTHKLEIIDAGEKTLEDMKRIAAEIFWLDPDELEPMRIDLCADVSGVPVFWWREHARFQFKRFSEKYAKALHGEEGEFREVGTAQFQTLYAGKRPNAMRVYDKRAEWWLQWSKENRRIAQHNRAVIEGTNDPEFMAAHPMFRVTDHLLQSIDFESWCAYKREGEWEKGQTLTRIERELGGGRIPEKIGTVAKLSSLPDFNPFERMQIVSSISTVRPSIDSVGSVRNWLAGIGFQKLVEEYGNDVQMAWNLVSRNAHGHGKELLTSLRPFWPSEGDYRISMAQVYETYRQTVSRQLAA